MGGLPDGFNRTVRYEWIAEYVFESLIKVEEFVTKWIWNYNDEHQNMETGNHTDAAVGNDRTGLIYQTSQNVVNTGAAKLWS